MRFLSFVASVVLIGASSLYANEMEHKSELQNYVAIKAMYALGENYKELDGQDGYGVSIDLGRRIGYGFAIELDVSYENADVKFSEGDEVIAESIDYYTSSIDLAYVYELTHKLGVLGKVGYEYEYADRKNESEHDTGFIFAGGFEYSVNHHYKALVEYETSTINGPKGDVVFAGVMYNF